MNKRFEFVDSNNNIFSLIITDNKEHTAELTSVNLDSEFKGELTIPSSVTYQGIPYTITSIREDDYKEYKNITSIKVPYSVTSIGNCAFAFCIGLTSITIPDSVTSIGYMAFDYCIGLTKITIPNDGLYYFAIEK
jgi:hypothetical protein